MARQALTITHKKAPRGLKKAVKLGVREGMEIAFAWWHRVIAPQHFEPSAVSKYGYDKRTKRYQQRKAVKFHHQRPLEWTGETKRKILGGQPEITVRGKTATMKFTDLPHYANIRSRPSKGGSRKQPDKQRELTFVTQSEADEMMDRITRQIEARMTLSK